MNSPRSSPLGFLLVAAATLAVSGRAQAQAANVSGKEYVLAHKSTFDAPVAVGQRNPFWPIGWVPGPVGPSAAPVLDVQADAFRVTSISVDYPALAVINGRTYGVGEQVPVTAHPGESVTVRQILDGVVILDYRGHALRATNGPAGRSGAQ